MSILPSTSGVYQILCVPTGKVYIGSAVNLARRWRKHCNDLRAGKHCNSHLQKAWNKHSESSFVVSVLELTLPEQLLVVEQYWINVTCCCKEEKGFNICEVAGSHLGMHRSVEARKKMCDSNARVWEGFINPNDEPTTITNLYDYCRQHNLSVTGMRALYRGKKPQYRGWTHTGVSPIPKPLPFRIWEGFISPSGELMSSIENLHKFCRIQGLCYSDMHGLYTGKLRFHRGWKHSRTAFTESLRTYNGQAYNCFINPGGEQISITNLARFCRENGLDEGNMRRVCSGTRKSYKGWTCDHERNYSDE